MRDGAGFIPGLSVIQVQVLAPGATPPPCLTLGASRIHGVNSQNPRVREAGGRARRWTNRSKVRHRVAPDWAWPAELERNEVSGSPPPSPPGTRC